MTDRTKRFSDTDNKVINSADMFRNRHVPNKHSTKSLLRETPLTVAVDEIEFYSNLSASSDMSDFMKRILTVVNRLGFSDYTFARLSQAELAEKLVTTPKELLSTYQSEAFYQDDIMLEYAAVNNTPIFQSTIDDYVNSAPFSTNKLKRNRELKQIVQSYGYQDYYALPLKAHNGSGQVLFTVQSKNVSRSDFQLRANQCRPVLRLLGEAIDYIGTHRFPDFFLASEEKRQIIITPRPLMLLDTLAKYDLTLKEAALKLDISVDTANKHMAAAKTALGVHTQAAAIYRAIKEGLISVKIE